MFKILKRGITKVKEDIQVIYDKDPAAENLLEVIPLFSILNIFYSHMFRKYIFKIGVRNYINFANLRLPACNITLSLKLNV